MHSVLLRQLKRYNLDDSKYPVTLEQWGQFLERVNHTYLDFDEDRYMIDRSQEISSREMQELYDLLENAEQIANIGSWILDIKTNRVKGSVEAYRILGISSSINYFDDFLKAIHPDDRNHLKEIVQTSIQQGTGFELDARVISPGSIRWVHIHGKPDFNKNDHLVGKLQGTIMDVTKQKSAAEILRKSEEKYRQLVELSPFGILIVVNERIVFINHAMITILNGETASQFIGRSVFDIVHPSFHKIVRLRIENIRIKHQPNEQIQETFIALDGKEKEMEVLSTPFEYEGMPAILAIAHDISTRILAENRLSFLMLHDPITGLANRKTLSEALSSSIFMSKKQNSRIPIIMYINIDRFKIINESLGLNIGDLLLQSVAKKLSTHIRASDLLGRLEGDLFVIVYYMPCINTNEIKNKAEEIKTAMKDVFIIQGTPIYITVSIGISIYPDDGEDTETLLKSADIALHFAKENGGNKVKFCSDELKNHISTTASLEVKLRRAVANGELYLEYQPKIALKNGEITGFEALLRMKDPINGDDIPPSKFIPIAEQIGLISPITEIVLNIIARQFKTWQTENLPIYPIAINLSPYNFHEMSLIKLFKSILTKNNLETTFFEVEITESAFFQSISSNMDVLKKFKDMGIKIAIDDFGTGYSSLSYLQYLEIDSLKIDQSFIKNIDSDPKKSTLVLAMIAMAHSLNIKVIAEGVETKEEFAFLRDHDCDEVQGFYISKPISSENLTLFIKKMGKMRS